MKDSEFFETCAEEIDKGWCQNKAGYWASETGEVCMVGALIRVTVRADDSNYAQLDRRRDIIQQRLGVSWIEAWNDTPGRTKEEVYDAFMGLAKKLRNEGE